MKNLKFALALSAILAFGCNQPENKPVPVTIDMPSNPAGRQTNEPAKPILNEADEDDVNDIKNIIDLFREPDIDKIADHISFPLNREYPIPSIKDEAEFKQRFSQVFDKALIEKIADSKIEQWSQMGWRGTMLDNGVVWLSYSGGKISAVNYETEIEKNMRNDLVAAEKRNVHVSLKTFESPVYKIITKNYRLRIDELDNDRYRYASWKANEKESSKPDIIIGDGELKFDGSGGNHVITFVSGNHLYKIYRIVLGEDGAPDILLEIEKDGKPILKGERSFIDRAIL